MDGFVLPDDHVLLKFHPRLRKNMLEIWTDGRIGISSRNMKVHTNTKMSSEEYAPTYNDTFVLEIPYAGQVLFWEVIFKDEDYDYPPDFEFPSDSFLFDPDINIITNYIPTLANWNVDNPKSLVCVLKELLLLYKKFQVMRLQTENKYTRLYHDYECLMSQAGNSEKNIEVFIDNSGVVHFLISISLKFTCFPPYIQPIISGKAAEILNPNEDTVFLRLSFIKPDSSKVQCDLHLSPRLEQVIGNSTGLHIPAFNKDSTLMEYIPQLAKLLEEKVQQISIQYKLKNDYISYVLSTCSCSIIEYDNTFFSKAVFLCEASGFYALVSIHLGNKFPQEQPKVTIRSVYQLQHEKPFVQNCDGYPYSPRWKTEEMVKRLINSLKEDIPNFQTRHKLLQSSFE